jgi:drug/metabolite transporter (DMT)-like permease
MRMFLLTALTMAAFAGNSLLNRFAVGSGAIDAASFALIRVVAGAAMLGMLVGLRNRHRGIGWPQVSIVAVPGVIGLTVYLIGFSVAYVSLSAGTGALILFGTVQITMFAGSVMQGKPVTLRRVAGAAIAFLGLVLLLWPGQVPLALGSVAAMIAAGLGWGIYSLAGANSHDALSSTTINFVLSVPFIVLFWLAIGAAPVNPGFGLWLGVLSGAVTSGLGYALWYAILPTLGAQRGAVAQLTVPLIAAAGGAVLLAEPVGLRFAFASLLVLGGVAIASLKVGQSAKAD